MSGGHYDYKYWKIQELSEDIKLTDDEGVEQQHRLFLRDVLVAVARASKVLEWVDSGDSNEGDLIEEVESLKTNWGRKTDG